MSQKLTLAKNTTFTPDINAKAGEFLDYTAPDTLVLHTEAGAETVINLADTPANYQLLLSLLWPSEQPELASFKLTKQLKCFDAKLTANVGDFFIYGGNGKITIMRAGVRIGGIEMTKVALDWLVFTGVLTPLGA